jgi:hypothetical protein
MNSRGGPITLCNQVFVASPSSTTGSLRSSLCKHCRTSRSRMSHHSPTWANLQRPVPRAKIPSLRVLGSPPGRATRRATPGRSFLNGGERWAEKSIEPRSNDRIALARRRLQSDAVSDLHQAATIAYEALILQRLSGERDRSAVSPHYLRKKLVGVGQFFAFGPIVHHKKPSTHSLFHRMKRVACNGLHDLR